MIPNPPIRRDRITPFQDQIDLIAFDVNAGIFWMKGSDLGEVVVTPIPPARIGVLLPRRFGKSYRGRIRAPDNGMDQLHIAPEFAGAEDFGKPARYFRPDDGVIAECRPERQFVAVHGAMPENQNGSFDDADPAAAASDPNTTMPSIRFSMVDLGPLSADARIANDIAAPQKISAYVTEAI
ncbi:hypothetical protein [Rhodopseudomonas sp.]|uniref:hypothetical protein n=1 Tax=Rhodopseudomonas sp. TaxID=1078 RepID=UPI0039E38B8F